LHINSTANDLSQQYGIYYFHAYNACATAPLNKQPQQQQQGILKVT